MNLIFIPEERQHSRGLTTFSSSIRVTRANAEHPLSLYIKSTRPAGLATPFATRLRQAIRQLHPVDPIHRRNSLQIIRIIHCRIMRTIQYIHAHVLHSIVHCETTGRHCTINRQMEQPERGTPRVELVARVAGEVEAEGLVVICHRRIDGAVE